MTETSWAAFRDEWLTLDRRARQHVPDFLVISPPRTGSTWLAAVLGRHPSLFVPSVPKEIKYFSNHWRTRDRRWYLNHFRFAADLTKGEASPSYSILPRRMIETINAAAPNIKIVYLMREPIERAWSHARHVFTYRETTFKDYEGTFESIPEPLFLETFTHGWALAQGDYLGTLSRWRDVFPRNRMFVGFYESIRTAPRTLLSEICRFLGVTPDVRWEDLGMTDVVNAGVPAPLPAHLRTALWTLYHRRTIDLVSCLRDEFNLTTPSEWQQTLGEQPSSELLPGAGSEALSHAIEVTADRLDDDALERILAHDTSAPATPALQDQAPGFARIINPDIRVSVIVPYFAKSSTIFECLERLRHQSLSLCDRDEVEIILVDDGTEGEDVRARLPEDVIYLWQRKRLFGAGRARNTGAKVANGRVLVFVDPDCLVTETHIDAVLRGFEQWGDRVVQAGYIADYHATGSPDPRTEFGVWNIGDAVSARFFQFAGGNAAVSRDVFFEASGFDEALVYSGVEDLVFGYQIGKLPRTGIYFNREMMSWHLPHPPSPAHATPAASWAVIKLKYPHFYDAYIVKGLR